MEIPEHQLCGPINAYNANEVCQFHQHYPLPVLHETFNTTVDKFFHDWFTNSSFYQKFMKVRKTYDANLENWSELPDENGCRTRDMAYTLSINYSIGPKCSPSTEHQIMFPDSKPGEFYLIDSECINGGVPYSDTFYCIVRYCIRKVAENKCDVRITAKVVYRKNTWGVIRNLIDRIATSGISDSFKVMAKLLRSEYNSSQELDQPPSASEDINASLQSTRLHRKGGKKHRSRRRASALSTAPTLRDSSNSELAVNHQLKEDDHSIAALENSGRSSRLTVDCLVRCLCVFIILLLITNVVLYRLLVSMEQQLHSQIPPQTDVLFHISERLSTEKQHFVRDFLQFSSKLLGEMQLTMRQLMDAIDKLQFVVTASKQ